jgi:hypothetical protein
VVDRRDAVFSVEQVRLRHLGERGGRVGNEDILAEHVGDLAVVHADARSPSGLPESRIKRFASSPASPTGTIFTMMPVRASNACSTDFETSNESCVRSVTVTGATGCPGELS